MNERIKSIEREMNKLKLEKSQGLISPEDFEKELIVLFDKLDNIDLNLPACADYVCNLSDQIKKNSNNTVAMLYPMGFSLN